MKRGNCGCWCRCKLVAGEIAEFTEVAKEASLGRLCFDVLLKGPDIGRVKEVNLATKPLLFTFLQALQGSRRARDT